MSVLFFSVIILLQSPGGCVDGACSSVSGTGYSFKLLTSTLMSRRQFQPPYDGYYSRSALIYDLICGCGADHLGLNQLKGFRLYLEEFKKWSINGTLYCPRLIFQSSLCQPKVSNITSYTRLGTRIQLEVRGLLTLTLHFRLTFDQKIYGGYNCPAAADLNKEIPSNIQVSEIGILCFCFWHFFLRKFERVLLFSLPFW